MHGEALEMINRESTKPNRRSGINILGDVPWGAHFCQFYQTKQDLIDVLVPYFKAGLEANEYCMWVTSEPLQEDEAVAALRSAMPDIDEYIRAGQIEIIPYNQWYLKNGYFDQKRVLNGWISKLDKALIAGYDGLRLSGNTFWLEAAGWDEFTEYEEAINSTIGKYRMIALCTYSLDKCSASEIADVVANHQFALMKRQGKWSIIESNEQKQAFEEREALVELLRMANEPVTLDRFLEAAVDYLARWSECEAIGIRLRDGNDYPFARTRGFTREFITAENSLCKMGPLGKLATDCMGAPALECMCGHVICGRFNPSKSYFTERGSFWTNNTTELVANATNDDYHLAHVRGRCVEEYRSVALVPVRSGAETYGLIQFEDKCRNRFSPRQIDLFEEVAGIIAGVIARRQAEDALRKQADDLQEANRRLELLAEIESTLLCTDDPIGAVQTLAQKVMEHLDCHVFFNYVADDDRGRLHLNAFAGVPAAVGKSIEWLDYGVAVCGCVARDAVRIIAENIQETPDERTNLVRGMGVRAYACHPLLSQGGKAIGTLSFGTRSRDTFTDDELALMKTVTDQVATAMERMRLYHRERHIAQMLQQALIPPTLPSEILGHKVATVYQPALKEAEVGGDFFDVFEIDENRIGILIGDIAGKGLKAAIGVASARYSIRSYAFLEASPGKVMTYVNESLCKNSSPEESLLTAFFAVLDTAAGTITYTNAGQEYPYICRREGMVEPLDGAPGCALGILPGFQYDEERSDLQAGDFVVLLTDGITEARTTADNLFGAEGVVKYLSCREFDSPGQLAHGLLKAATAHAEGRLQDDAAVVVIGR